MSDAVANAPVMGTCEAAGGPSGINLDGLPPLPDADALEGHARTMSAVGSALSDGADDAARRWAGLAGVYEAPESDVVLAGFVPVRARARNVDAALASVAASLSRYAERSRGLLGKVSEVRAAVASLDALILGNDDWQSKHGILNQHRDTYNQVSALAQEILASDAECANDLAALIGGGKVSAPVVEKLEIGTSKDPFSNALSHVRHFFGGDEEHPDQRWGPPTPSMRLQGGWAVGQGAVSAFIGSVQGSYTLIGTSDAEQQRQAWQGLGGLLVAGVRASLAVQRGPQNLSADDLEAIMTVNEAGKSAFYVDRWEKDAAFSAGSLGFDIGSIFIGGGAAMKGGSLGAKAEKLGAKTGTAAEDAASTGSRLVTRLEDLPSDARLAEKFRDALAPAQDAVSSMKTGTWGVGIKSELDELKKAGGDGGTPAEPNAVDPSRSRYIPGQEEAFRHPETSHGKVLPDRINEPAEHSRYGLHREDMPSDALLEGRAKYPEDIHPDLLKIVDPGQPKFGVDEQGQALTEQQYTNRYSVKNDRTGLLEWERYPDNAGAVEGTIRSYSTFEELLADFPNVKFDRVGPGGGSYLAIEGTPWHMRGLPVSSLGRELHHYELGDFSPAIRIEVSEIAPAFGRPGGGTQIQVIEAATGAPLAVDDAINLYGVLREVRK